jgi:hypothetical protein
VGLVVVWEVLYSVGGFVCGFVEGVEEEAIIVE